MPIMKPKTPYIYLQQIDAWGNSNSCGTQTVMNQLYYRCKQIQPNCTLQDVQNLLASNQMPMGENSTLLAKADQTQSLVMDPVLHQLSLVQLPMDSPLTQPITARENMVSSTKWSTYHVILNIGELDQKQQPYQKET